jgi:SAM-dependent methyltransferase
MTTNAISSPRLHSLLEYYWLRPETAMWRTLDCRALDNFKFRRPILDLGCGDGAFSFLRAGGTYHAAQDAFTQVGDLHKFFDGEDIYDHFDPSLEEPRIVTRPSYQIDVGLDHKGGLLKKANATGLYAGLLEADANNKLPLASESFSTVFSNIVYWLPEYKSALSEIARVLKPDGKAYLHVPSETFREYSFYYQCFVKSRNSNWKWLEQIDRGRTENVKLCQSFEEWEADFRSCGLVVLSYQRYLSKLTLQIWDIGLRPLSPVLIEMAGMLSSEHRLSIKSKWVNILYPFLQKICAADSEEDRENPPGFLLFELTKA